MKYLHVTIPYKSIVYSQPGQTSGSIDLTNVFYQGDEPPVCERSTADVGQIFDTDDALTIVDHNVAYSDGSTGMFTVNFTFNHAFPSNASAFVIHLNLTIKLPFSAESAQLDLPIANTLVMDNLNNDTSLLLLNVSKNT